ncbi:hypothetical protein PV797_19270 [Clostridiaceae bacterium M8S5]|nr:hypothetical protein PV797_19270 [Clostridiaceae bacterium M8S5]
MCKGLKMKNKDWYKKGWSLNIKEQFWTEETKAEIDFIVDVLKLEGHERIENEICRK